jgi:hypothetical protein
MSASRNLTPKGDSHIGTHIHTVRTYCSCCNNLDDDSPTAKGQINKGDPQIGYMPVPEKSESTTKLSILFASAQAPERDATVDAVKQLKEAVGKADDRGEK